MNLEIERQKRNTGGLSVINSGLSGTVAEHLARMGQVNLKYKEKITLVVLKVLVTL